ncbi:MAG: hypothetical protein JST00_35720 [Deltaproteobacteria bacterium]|nr:hypothetical protein [Deltaproteobacteria bacterium]
MNRLLHASLLPVVLASLSTVACTAETQGDGAKVDATQSPAELLAGQAGTPTAPVQGYAPAQTITSGRATLVVDGTSYDLLSYSFGVSRAAEAGVTREAARPELASLHVLVRPSAKEAVLRKAVLDRRPLETVKIVLFPNVDAGVKQVPIELAVFGTSFVESMGTAAGGSTTESYALAASKVTVAYAGASATVDALTGTATAVGCGSPASLPTYSQANAGELATYPLLPGATRLDGVSVGITSPSADPSKGGGMSTPKLEGIYLGGNLERGGVCGFYYAASSAMLETAKFGVAGAIGATTGKKPYESISWTACKGGVDSVQIASGGEGAPIEVIQLGAAGLLRTDRTLDAKTGKLTESSTGWSFANHGSIASCAEAL